MTRQLISKADQQRARDAGDNRCAKCGTTHRIVIDHMLPVVRGGTNDPENLQLLCHSCNTDKGVRTQSEWDRGIEIVLDICDPPHSHDPNLLGAFGTCQHIPIEYVEVAVGDQRVEVCKQWWTFGTLGPLENMIQAAEPSRTEASIWQRQHGDAE